MKTPKILLFSALLLLLLASSSLAMVCVDSDGEDVMTKGFVQGNWFSNGNDQIHNDFCSGNEAVYEALCIDGKGYSQLRSCPSGTECQQGACVEVDTKSYVACSETDQGRDHYTKGSATGTYWSTGVYHEGEDYCDIKGQLGELYCNSQGYMYIEYLKAPEGYECTDGTFVKLADSTPEEKDFDIETKDPKEDSQIPSFEETPSEKVPESEFDDVKEELPDSTQEVHFCEDSDNGIDEFTTGVAESKNTVISEQGTAQIIYDEKKDTCSYAKDYDLDEFFCQGSQILSKKISCQNGFSCIDGSCVEFTLQDLAEDKSEEFFDDSMDTYPAKDDSYKETKATFKKDSDATFIELEASCQNGCMVEGSCVPVGFRFTNEVDYYCTIGNQVQVQLEEGSACSNNFECSTNSCVSSECRDLVSQLEETQGLLEKLLSLFNSLFGKRE